MVFSCRCHRGLNRILDGIIVAILCVFVVDSSNPSTKNFISVLKPTTQMPEDEGVSFQPQYVKVEKTSETTVRIRWGLNPPPSDVKYEVEYKPTDARFRIVTEVLASKEVVLQQLKPDTKYELRLVSIANNTVLWSSPTLTFVTTDAYNVSDGDFVYRLNATRTYPGVRAEEIGIVLLVLAFWMFAIVLFFNRWGKIRMLEPYQAPYKELPQPSSHRPSCPMLDHRCMSPKILSGNYMIPKRPRLNSVFVGRTRSFSVDENPPRRVKSALNLTSLVLTECDEEYPSQNLSSIV